jgi:hypothetical protein
MILHPLKYPYFPKNYATMKKPILYLGFAMLNIQFINAQYFTKITDGDIVNTLSDSRSCNWVDFNNDGWQDVQITNGKYPGENNMLYINNGDGTFETVVSGSIVSDLKPSDGATWADHDNDGDIDCFVVNWYGVDNLFYDNNGDETFTQVTVGTIVEDNGYSETASWGDYNNDSYVDIYVSNSGGTKKNYLYKNNGDGSFLKIIDGEMVNDNDSTRSVNWVDYDMDGDADIFVTSEANQHERLYRNNGDETFTSITDNALVTDAGSTMSSSWGDIDNDGDLDVFLANDQGNDALFRNDGDNVFTKLSSDIVCNNGGNSFGSNFADIDNDGDIDLFVTNSFGGGPWNNFLYLNDGTGVFTAVTTDVTTTDLGWSYGNAFGDYDKDGDMDLLVANCYGGAQNNALYKNETTGNNWLIVDCTGMVSNKSAIGTIVKVKAMINGEHVWQMRDITAQSGYCGQNMLPAHFGLGDATIIDSLIIQWPSGIVDKFEAVNASQYLKVTEGETVTGIVNLHGNEFNLKISPNPSSSSVIISYNLLRSENVRLELFDTAGNRITFFDLKDTRVGDNTFKFDLNNLALYSGNYYLVIKTSTSYGFGKINFIK